MEKLPPERNENVEGATSDMSGEEGFTPFKKFRDLAFRLVRVPKEQLDLTHDNDKSFDR